VKAPREVLVVPHTHWDREWHAPFQVFRFELVRVVDGLLDLLARDPKYRSFTLDGQTVILEDYLEIRPEREARLAEHVRAGRLLIGPWYVQPDEFLSSGEALIRNLLVGRSVAGRFGAPMAVGLCPDAFGHISQLPQILLGFGIDSAIFSRGLGDEGEDLGSEFIWEGPDGGAVLAIHQIGGALDRNNGYYNAALLGHRRLWGEHAGAPDSGCAREHAAHLVGILRRYARTPYLLFNNGGDHLGPQPELPALLADLNARLPGLHFRQGSYPQYVALVRATAGALARRRGELRGARYSHLLSGVFSARLPLKQANARVQVALERWAEPFGALARLEGAADTRPFLKRAWKLLLLNQAHDSIGGCSVDQVHAEMLPRFDQAEQIAACVTEGGLGHLVDRLDTADLPPGPLVAVFNPTGVTRTEQVVGSVPLPAALCAGPLVAVDRDGTRVPCQVLGRETATDVEPVEIALLAAAVPGLGYRTFAVQPGTAPGVRVEAAGAGMVLENARYRAEVGPHGRLRIVHRPSGHMVEEAHTLLDEADAGDAYNFAPASEAAPGIRAGGPARLSVRARGPARAVVAIERVLSLPASAADGRRHPARVPVPVRVEVALTADGCWVEFRTEIENRARDHRLRAVFPTGLEAAEVEVLGHFDRLRRPVSPPPRPDWPEPPGPTNHQNGYVAVLGARAGVAVLSPELPEYVAKPGRRGVDLSLTLLRCVGRLSGSALPTRPEPAGPPLPTPGAQCPGHFTSRYALAIFAPGEAPELPHWSEEFRAPLRLLPAPRQRGPLPDTRAFLEVEGRAVLTALKEADEGDGLIARLYNPGDTTIRVTLRYHRPLRGAWQCRLDELRLSPLPVRDSSSFGLEIGAREIRTVCLEAVEQFA
jgi:alpha-mannosidase